MMEMGFPAIRTSPELAGRVGNEWPFVPPYAEDERPWDPKNNDSARLTDILAKRTHPPVLRPTDGPTPVIGQPVLGSRETSHEEVSPPLWAMLKPRSGIVWQTGTHDRDRASSVAKGENLTHPPIRTCGRKHESKLLPGRRRVRLRGISMGEKNVMQSGI